MWNIIGDSWMCWHFNAKSLMTERKVERCFAPPHYLQWLRNAKTLPTKNWSSHSTPTTMLSTRAIPSSSIFTPFSPDLSQRTLIDIFKTPFISFQNPSIYFIPLFWIWCLLFLSIFVYFDYMFICSKVIYHGVRCLKRFI